MTLRRRHVCAAMVAIAAVATSAIAAPPGIEWELIPELSDEFNVAHANPSGDGIDRSKWWDFHPTWSGRLPSQFSPANSWVQDGRLNLRSTARVADLNEVDDPFTDHWVDSAIITSRAEARPGDYFEASIKTAALSMPSSWWFRQGSKSEIDVIENIGAPTNPYQKFRETAMAYNTHFYDPGNNVARGGEAQMVDDAGDPIYARDQFVTYGVWWKSPTEIVFYYNGNEAARVTPPGLLDEGLNMHFDMEVFTWAGLPSLASLNDPTKNTMQVDWVRGYRPADSAEVSANHVDNSSFELSHPGQPDRPDFWADCGNFGCGSATPFETRSSETARTGQSSLKIDNSQPNSFSQYKEIRSRDSVYSVLPGDTIRHEVWIKLTEAWENSNETFALAIRLNGESSQPRTGPGEVSLADGSIIAQFDDSVQAARELNINSLFGGQQLDQWVKVAYEFEIPATDSTGKPVEFVTSLSYIDNKTAAPPSQGILFLDDFSFEVLQDELPGDFDHDADVDGADFLRWQNRMSTDPASESRLRDWETNYGRANSDNDALKIVPEPVTSITMGSGAMLLANLSAAVKRHRASPRSRTICLRAFLG